MTFDHSFLEIVSLFFATELNLSVLDVVVIFFAGGAVITGLTVAIYMLRSFPKQRYANRFLALLYIGVSLFLIDETLAFGGFFRESVRLYYLPTDYTWSFGPLMYFYIRTILRSETHLSRRDWLHFVMPLVQVLFVVVLGVQSVDTKFWFWQNVDIPWFGIFDEYWTAGSMLVYGVMAWGLLRNSAETTLSTQTLTWLKSLHAVFFVCALISALVQSLIPLFYEMASGINLNMIPIYDALPTIIFASSAFYIAAGGFTYNQQLERVQIVKAPRKETYDIDEATLARYSAELATLMETEQPWLNPALTLQMVADRLNIPSRHLSYVINEAHNQGFADYVNTHRVNAACDVLASPGNKYLSVLDIGLNAGFNSKSTFNRVFKQLTGQTPGQYRTSNLPTD